jgi:hypothetical protein
MFWKRFLNKKPKGYIRCLGLEDWWLSLTEEQREDCRCVFDYEVNGGKENVDIREIAATSMTRQGLLRIFASGVMNLEFKLQLLDFAEREAVSASDIVELHYIYMTRWKLYKRLWSQNSSWFEHLETYLKKDISIYGDFYEGLKREGWKELPNYPAFKELALLYERTGRYRDAIKIVEEAMVKNVKEGISFERRLKRLTRLETGG